jgi:predicted nucleic acid-binding protein
VGTLLDSCVLIGLERTGSPLALPDDEEVGIAAITASELLHGVHRADPPRRAQREAFVEHVLRVLPVYLIRFGVGSRACTVVGRPGDGGSPDRTARSVACGDSTGSRLVRRYLQRE